MPGASVVDALGIAVVGAGRIGSLRGRLAVDHPAVDVVAVSDRDGAAARKLAAETGASSWSVDNEDAIAHPGVDGVIVSTSEGEHTAAVLRALELNKHVLVEKPIALDLHEADEIAVAVAQSGASLRVGYSRRFRRRYLLAKEQVVQGRLGRLLGGTARMYNSRSQALAMLQRNPQATPVVDALTYYVDLMNWFFAGHHVVEVSAAGQRGVLAAAGYDTDDVTWAIVRYDDGAVLSLGVSYALPESYPSRGHAARVELIGSDGVILLDDDHTDQVMHTEHGMPHVYLPDEAVNTVFLSSSTPGDWALGEFVGPLAFETRTWFDHLITGRDCALATADEARATLEVTLAIERAVAEGAPMRLPLDPV